METPVQNPVPIGQHEGWDLFYIPTEDKFLATKGRKKRVANYINHLTSEIENVNSTEKREVRREIPCEFWMWSDEKQHALHVQMTSYSTRGLGLRNLATQEVDYLETGWGSKEHVVPVIPNGRSTKRLLTAIEMLRRAQEELRKARQEVVVDVQFTRVTGNSVEPYFEEEDRLRTEINKLNP